MYYSLINPVAFQIGSLPVHWYGMILGFGAFAGLLLAIQEGKRFGVSADFFLDLLLFGVPSAIIVARIYYVAFKWGYYSKHPGEIIQIWAGGIAIYGALIGALLCGFFYIRAKGYSFWRIADICAPSLLIGQMIGRWGNFVNQEAYGGPTTETFLRDSLHLPSFIVNQMNVEGTFHHPTFLYESLWSLVGLVILFVIRRRNFLRAGEQLITYFIWYSIGRFFIEALRTDSLAFQGPDWLASLVNGIWTPMTAVFEQGSLNAAEGNIRISQLLALLIVIAGIVLIIVRRQRGWAKERYVDPLVNVKLKAKEETDTTKETKDVQKQQEIKEVQETETTKNDNTERQNNE
ncbi:MAG: prolipoprotein diacylglyceryl transferase [Candidatus Cohnella colombiensis]|uniref:Phosphatidylglycerol--prolipoprotein diacylglyceryl transferase n=1 Tax=Candidatus Cohnella colombiensis TaxID=3121368 RepID=A0AA95F457_9BACL|nr:MAG: prolipoprotein diacylglyceryl transferase [Cohnella sp.]